MTARDDLYLFALDGKPHTEAVQGEATAKLDAYRTEVLANAIGRLHAIPVDCTALTGPVWYGTGWADCITALKDIADYQLPDQEDYPGELERLRARVRDLRVAALRREDLPRVQQILIGHAEYEANARRDDADPGFFRAGRLYRRTSHGTFLYFQVDGVATSPDGRERIARGWLRSERSGSAWYPRDEAELADWADVTGVVAVDG